MLSFLYLKDWEKHFLDAGASKPSDWNSELDGDWLQKPPYQVCGFFLQWLWTLVVVLASVPPVLLEKNILGVTGSKSNLARQLPFVKMTHRDPSLLASTWAGSLFSFYSNPGGDCDSREPDCTVFWGWLLLKEFMQRKWREGGLGSCRLSSSKNERQSAFNKKKKMLLTRSGKLQDLLGFFFLSRGNEKTWIPFISCRKIHGILVLVELATLDRKKTKNKPFLVPVIQAWQASTFPGWPETWGHR